MPGPFDDLTNYDPIAAQPLSPLLSAFAGMSQALQPYAGATRVPTSPGIAFGQAMSGLTSGYLAGQRNALEYEQMRQQAELNQYNVSVYRQLQGLGVDQSGGGFLPPMSRGQALAQTTAPSGGGTPTQPTTGLLSPYTNGSTGVAPLPPVSIEAQPASSRAGSTPLPLDRNNPGNIRYDPANKWVGRTTDPQRNDGFESFDTPVNGVRATDKVLQSYDRLGINTLTGVINRWSPPSENNTPALIAAASQRAGFAPDEPIDLGNPQQRARVVQAIIAQEQGPTASAYTQDIIHAGMNAAGAKPALPVDRSNLDLQRVATGAGPVTGGLLASGPPTQPVTGGLLAPGGRPVPLPSPTISPLEAYRRTNGAPVGGAPLPLPPSATTGGAAPLAAPAPAGGPTGGAMPPTGGPQRHHPVRAKARTAAMSCRRRRDRTRLP
jgi:hypothetical protein